MKSSLRQSLNHVLKALPAIAGGLALMSSQAFAAGSWSTEEFPAFSGDDLHIYLPTTSPAENSKRALMINLHGCSMDSDDMKDNAGWETIADEYGMVVAHPDVPGSGVNGECWDYYGSSHTRSNKYNDDIIDLAEDLIDRTGLNIDPLQVYLTGFSSGGGQASVIACLAPDIFAGVGAHSGPGLGSTTYQYGTVPWGYSVSTQATNCDNFAGSNDVDLATQLYSTLHGASDSVVDPEYNETGADIMADVYGADTESSSSTIATGGTEVIWSDDEGPRVSRISVSGLGHDWSSDDGNTGYFVNTKVDYPEYVTDWFFANNRRLPTGTGGTDADSDGFDTTVDCDDTDNSIFPGATEICGDSIDQNCTGADLACGGWTCETFFTYNTTHYNATLQRATYLYFGFAYHYYAKGDGVELTYTGPFSLTYVSETAEGYFEQGACP